MSVLSIKEPKLQPLDPRLCKWMETFTQVISSDALRANMADLPGPRNRLHAPDAMKRTTDFLLQRFSELHWTTTLLPFTLNNVRGGLDYDTFETVTYEELSGINIMALKAGEASRDALLVLGHYDTVRDSPGADDNTASVAALLELARVLAPYRFQRTLILATTDMEELGFLGAKELAARLTQERTIVGVINFETMAYTALAPKSQSVPPGMDLLYRKQVKRILARQKVGDFTSVIYNRSARTLATAFASGLQHISGPEVPMLLGDPTSLPFIGKILRRFVPSVSNFARSDHAPFWALDIPAIQITDTANLRNPHYHQPTDTPETLDYDRLAAIVGATAIALSKLGGLLE